ncbi:MAG: transporter substrate-binding domain-containing protein [Bdellovibrionaceae bacterium]|nr:transporter substrate-binding domain-containing protein [Pseudobdellovibrionaceae bacterium]
MKIVILSVFLGTLICCLGHSEPTQTIRFSIAESWSEPYAFFDNNKNLVGGAMKEVIDEIAIKLNSTATYIYLSRNRVDAAAEKKQIDIRCFMNEGWTVKSDIYDWSREVFGVSNSVIWKKGKSPIMKLTDLESKTVGTVSGYIYKGLEAQMKSGKITRSDVASEQMNLTLLQKNRLDYAIVGTAAFHWLLQKEESASLKDTESFVIDSTPTKCAVLKNGKIKVENLDEALNKIKSEGTLKKIQSKYGI